MKNVFVVVVCYLASLSLGACAAEATEPPDGDGADGGVHPQTEAERDLEGVVTFQAMRGGGGGGGKGSSGPASQPVGK